MDYEFKPHPDARVALWIGYGAVYVTVDDCQVEFVPVLDSGAPECR